MNVTYDGDGVPMNGEVKSGSVRAEVKFHGGTATIGMVTTSEIEDDGRQRGYVPAEHVTDIIAQIRALPFVDEIDAFGLGVTA